MTTPPALTPVEVNLLTGSDETAKDHKLAVITAATRAGTAMHFDTLPAVRRQLAEALDELDALEARLNEIRGQR